MRTLWEGAEGICWLCVADADQIKARAASSQQPAQGFYESGPVRVIQLRILQILGALATTLKHPTNELTVQL